jgi:hypothetical protein
LRRAYPIITSGSLNSRSSHSLSLSFFCFTLFRNNSYQDQVAIYTIDEIELISGSLPTRQKRLVEAWAELHQQELVSNWERLQGGQGPRPISPLK